MEIPLNKIIYGVIETGTLYAKVKEKANRKQPSFGRLERFYFFFFDATFFLGEALEALAFGATSS